MGMSLTSGSSRVRGCTISIAFWWRCGLRRRRILRWTPGHYGTGAGRDIAGVQAGGGVVYLSLRQRSGQPRLETALCRRGLLGGGIAPKILPFFKAKNL